MELPWGSVTLDYIYLRGTPLYKLWFGCPSCQTTLEPGDRVVNSCRLSPNGSYSCIPVVHGKSIQLQGRVHSCKLSPSSLWEVYTAAGSTAQL